MIKKVKWFLLGIIIVGNWVPNARKIFFEREVCCRKVYSGGNSTFLNFGKGEEAWGIKKCDKKGVRRKERERKEDEDKKVRDKWKRK